MPHLGNIAAVFAYAALALLLALLSVRAALGGITSSSLRQAFACSLPLVAAAAGAYLHDGISSAISVLFTCATASALFCSAAALITSESAEEKPPASAAMLLPLGIAVLLIGTTGRMTLASAVGLALLGLVACDLLNSESNIAPSPHRGHALAHLLLAALPVALLVFISRQLLVVSGEVRPFSQSGAAILLLLAPAVIIPTLIRGMHAAASPHPSAALRLCAAQALLAVCFYLPVLIGVDYALQLREREFPAPVAIPPLHWRLDGALLTVAGFTFAALRFDLLRPSRRLGFLLIGLYAAYVILSLAHRLV